MRTTQAPSPLSSGCRTPMLWSRITSPVENSWCEILSGNVGTWLFWAWACVLQWRGPLPHSAVDAGGSVRLAEEEDKTIEEPTILDYLTYAMYMGNSTMRRIWLRGGWSGTWACTCSEHLRYFQQMIDEQEKERKKGDEGNIEDAQKFQNNRFQNEQDQYRASQEFSTYEALCRGEKVIPLKNTHKLTGTGSGTLCSTSTPCGRKPWMQTHGWRCITSWWMTRRLKGSRSWPHLAWPAPQCITLSQGNWARKIPHQ